MRLNVFSSTSRQKRKRRLISIWIVTERIDEVLAKVCSSMSVNFVVDGRVFWRFAGVTCTALPHIATRRHPRFEKAVHVISNTSALRLFDICPKKGVCVRSEERQHAGHAQHFPNGDKTKSRLCLWPYSRAGCDLDANLEEFSSADL
jgi:hypothetical protein